VIPVQQTNTGGRGNCMSACWASILEVPIESVPDYRAIDAAGGHWLNAVSTWLSKHHGCVYLELEPYVTAGVIPLGWHLINFGTREFGHSVVGFSGRPVWDPRGAVIQRASARPYSYGLLVPLTDDLRATWQPTWGQCLCPSCLRTGGL
jgi:hypothetical protein